MQRKAGRAKSHLQFGELLSQGHYCDLCVLVSECVCSSMYLCVCLPNTIMQPFPAAAECSKSIKEPTEVPSVDHSGSVPEPGLCFKKDVFLTLVNVKVNSQSTGLLYVARTRKCEMEPVPF